MRSRGRDAAAVHNVLSEAHHQSPALLHALLQDHVEELSEFIQGQGLDKACTQFGKLSRRWSALHIPGAHGGSGLVDKLIDNAVRAIQNNAQGADKNPVEVVVISDGEHVGHAGDLGVWCAGSVRPKAALHAAMAGLHPSKTLAIVLDLGTDNPGLQQERGYAGSSSPRVRGAEAVQLWRDALRSLAQRAPGALIHYDSLSAGGDLAQLLDQTSQHQPLFNEATHLCSSACMCVCVYACRACISV